MTAEKFAQDLAITLVAQRGAEALPIARLVLMKLAEMKGRAQCAVCSRDFKRSMPHQVYCGKKCRERRKYLAQCAEIGKGIDYLVCPQRVVGSERVLDSESPPIRRKLPAARSGR